MEDFAAYILYVLVIYEVVEKLGRKDLWKLRSFFKTVPRRLFQDHNPYSWIIGLEEKGLIGEGNLSIFKEVFERIRRKDLLRSVERYERNHRKLLEEVEMTTEENPKEMRVIRGKARATCSRCSNCRSCLKSYFTKYKYFCDNMGKAEKMKFRFFIKKHVPKSVRETGSLTSCFSKLEECEVIKYPNFSYIEEFCCIIGREDILKKMREISCNTSHEREESEEVEVTNNSKSLIRICQIFINGLRKRQKEDFSFWCKGLVPESTLEDDVCLWWEKLREREIVRPEDVTFVEDFLECMKRSDLISGIDRVKRGKSEGFSTKHKGDYPEMVDTQSENMVIIRKCCDKQLPAANQIKCDNYVRSRNLSRKDTISSTTKCRETPIETKLVGESVIKKKHRGRHPGIINGQRENGVCTPEDRRDTYTVTAELIKSDTCLSRCDSNSSASQCRKFQVKSAVAAQQNMYSSHEYDNTTMAIGTVVIFIMIIRSITCYCLLKASVLIKKK